LLQLSRSNSAIKKRFRSSLMSEVKAARGTYRARQTRRVLSAVFGYGLSDYLVDENPVRRTKTPRSDEIEETVDPFSKEGCASSSTRLGPAGSGASSSWRSGLVCGPAKPLG
jgi:hypothetical protein